MALWNEVAGYLRGLTLADGAERALHAGDRAMARREFAAALAAYREGLRAERDYAPLHLKAGTALYFMGDQEGARSCFMRALRLQSRFPEAEFWLGLSQAAEGLHDEALAQYRRARRAGLSGTALAGAEAESLLAAGDGGRAVAAYERLLDLLPGDPAALRGLARSLLLGGSHAETDRVLGARAGSAPPPDVAGVLAVARALSGRVEPARQVLEGLLATAPDDPQVFAALGLTLAAAGEAGAAEGCLRQALRVGPGRPLPAYHLACVLAEEGRLEDSLTAAREAAVPQGGAHGGAVEAPSPGERPPEGEAVPFGVGGQAEVLLCLGLSVFLLRELERGGEARRRGGELPEAGPGWVAEFRRLAGLDAPRVTDAPPALREYVAGVRALEGGGEAGPALAADAFRSALVRVESSSERFVGPLPRKALVTALRRRLEGCGASVIDAAVAARPELALDETRTAGRFVSVSDEVVPLLNRALVVAGGAPDGAAAAVTLTGLREDYDRPLLVTVMGEFNTGKSSFINALVGEAVAPMGVVPTTATINCLRYGARKGIRVVFRDGRTEEYEVDHLAAFVDERAGDKATLREVETVEILYPLDVLRSVTIVDTPGLNAPIPEHEETTRRFLERSDAVIWLFSATQAGKASERAVVDLVRAHARKAVGVVNKVDRVTPEEAGQILEDLRGSFGDCFSAIGAVSARGALKARQEGDDEALAASRFPELEKLLDANIFGKTRRIKDGGTLDRLLGALRPLTTGREAEEMAFRARELELESLGERLSLRRTETRMASADDLRGAADEGLASAARLCARDLADLLVPESGILATTMTLPARSREGFTARLAAGLADLVSGAAEAALLPGVAAFEDEVAAEWETVLAAMGSGEAFAALARPWMRGAARDLACRLVRAPGLRLLGALDEGLMTRMVDRAGSEAPEGVLAREVERAWRRALEAVDDALADWSDEFFGTLETLRLETGALVRERRLERAVGFHEPLAAVAARATELLARLDEQSE